MRRPPRLLHLVIAGLLAACTTTVPPAPAPAPPPPGFPASLYQQARARGEAVYAIDPTQSLVVIRVYRTGSLARFGHDHVIASRDVHGYVLQPADPEAARADLYAPLAALTVDEPALRAAAGVDTTPSQDDIDGTRRNMLEHTLAVGEHPHVRVHVPPAVGRAANPQRDVEITLRGVTRRLPVAITLAAEGATLRASGQFALQQTDFGIAPYSVLGGALAVQDRVDITFELRAQRL